MTSITSNYNIGKFLVLTSFVTTGVGNHIFGTSIGLDLSIYFLLLLSTVVIIEGKIVIDKSVVYFLIVIATHTFLLNYSNLFNGEIIKHYLGFSLTLVLVVVFLTNQRNKVESIINAYFNLCFYLSLFSIIQHFLFVAFSITFIPQNLISGINITGSAVFIKEVLVFARGLGLSTEPANFSFILMPAVHISIYSVLNGEKYENHAKIKYYIVIISMLMTFSLVAYIGILLSTFFSIRKSLKLRSFNNMIYLIAIFSFLLLKTTPGQKAITFIKYSQSAAQQNFEVHSISSFAIVSNFLVALDSQKDNYFLGSGIDTHKYEYDKRIYKLFDPNLVPLELNRENAASIYIRIFSEFGLVGLLIFLFFLFRLYTRSSLDPLLRDTAFITVIHYSLRSGHYISITFIFFLALLYVASKHRYYYGSTITNINNSSS